MRIAVAPTTTVLRRARRSDVGDVARLHRVGLPNGFFARLGPSFLAGYHRGFVDAPDGVAIVARDGATVVGFVVGSTRARHHSRWMVRHRGGRLALLGVWGMLLRPAVLATFLRTRLRRYLRGLWRRVRPWPSRRSVADDGAGDDPAVLQHLVVDDAARGHGTGAALVQAFVDELRDRGVSHVRLVTDAHDGAGPVYDRLGWTRTRERPGPDGTVLAEYALDLTGEPA